jgi:hypothetical protein
VTHRETADAIADLVFKWTAQVLSVEDREQIAELIEKPKHDEHSCGVCQQDSAFTTSLPISSCPWCFTNTSPHHDRESCKNAWVAQARSLRSAGRV